MIYLVINTVFPLSHVFQISSTATDPELGFTIVSCFISPNSNPRVQSDYTLIETVCPKDDSVRHHPQRDFLVPHAQPRRKSFSFTFNSKFNMSLLFLHCEMSLCSKRSHSNQRLPPVRRRPPRRVLLFPMFFLDKCVTQVLFV